MKDERQGQHKQELNCWWHVEAGKENKKDRRVWRERRIQYRRRTEHPYDLLWFTLDPGNYRDYIYVCFQKIQRYDRIW